MREGWKEKFLWEICEDIFAGGDVPKNNFSKIKSEKFKVPVYSNGVKDKGLYGYTNTARVKSPSITVSARGTIGYSEIRKEAFFPVVRLIVIIPNEDLVLLPFLNYFLSTINFSNSGTSIPQLTVPAIKKYKITVPEKCEQKKVVALLDEAFTSIDQAKANIEKNIANAKELFQSKLNEIFSQRGEGWEERNIKDIGVVQTGTTPPTKDKSNYGDFIPFIKPAHFQFDGSLEHNDSMLSEIGLKKGRLFQENSILMVCIGATIGKTGFSTIPVSSNQQINALTPFDQFEPKMFYYALISPFVQRQVMEIGQGAQATLPIINKTKWENLKVRFPTDKALQAVLVKKLDELKRKTLEMEDLYKVKMTALEELKKSLLQKAFSGELTRKEEMV